MKLKFIPSDYEYFVLNGKTYMKIFGKTSEGKTCCLIDETVNFFYVLNAEPEKLIKKIKDIEGVKRVELVSKNYLGKPVKVIKVFCEYHEMQGIAHKIKGIDKGVETRERDINQITRYITEKKIKPLVWYEIQGSPFTERVEADFVIKLEKAWELEKQPDFKPKVLAFDIETEQFEIGRGKILMLSLVSDNFRKVLTWKKTNKAKKYVEFCKDEKEMLEKFMQYTNKINPDIITGYFSDGFDFPYIRARAEKHGLDLRLGMTKSRIVFSKGRPLNAKIIGLVHVDLLKFIETVYSQYLQSETLNLNDVAKELIGEEKLKINHNKVHEFEEKEWNDFFEYNLQDSVLAYKLFQKLWPDMLELTRIIQEPLFTITRQSMSGLVESYFLHNLVRFNEIAEKRPIHEEIEKRRQRQKYEGAFVLQPQPALYENLAIFDFTSMYASIIVSFNLSLSTFLGEKEQANSLEVDIGKKVYFSKKKGFVAKLLEEIIRLRKKYKEELKKEPNPIKKARSNAFKLLANAIYGYHGFFGARYYCPEAAASTAALARKFIKETIDKTNRRGYEVIYADTDGFAFLLNKKTKEETLEFLKKLNTQLPGIMELDLEDFYKRGIWVTKRTGAFGAKKKYALINEQGKIKIRGFETVRRDWCALARQVQNKVLKMILKEGTHENALVYVQEVIKKLKKREIPKEELIIKTQLKKPVSEYKSEGPHVTIAKKMLKRGMPTEVGMLIHYYVSDTGKSKDRIKDRAKLPDEEGKYDVKYYMHNQILPAVENIFEVFGVKEKDILESEQKKLDFFG